MAQSDEAVTETLGATRIPPYISFQTFLTFLHELKTNGTPPQIDSSVLKRFSGGVQGQLKMALRSLGLVDNQRPTPRLVEIVDAFETPAFEGQLLGLLKAIYPYVFDLDLMTATPTMFADAFKVTGAKEDVSRKCRTFFLHAAKRAGVQLGQRILSGSVPRAANGSVPKRKPKADKLKEDDGTVHEQKNDPGGKPDKITNHALEYHLIDLMRKDGIEQAEREAIWTLVQYLTKRPNETTVADQK